jgi:hypothetical protein
MPNISFQMTATTDDDAPGGAELGGGVATANARRIVARDEPPKDYFELDRTGVCIGSVILLGLIVMAACISESFHYVNYDEYGLLQDVYGDVRLSKVYEEGRYFFPLNYDMLKFPSHYQSVNFDAVVFTETGLEFSVEIGFYYKIPKENLGALYDSFSNNYHDRVVSNAQTTIKNIAAPLNINTYLTNRTYVQNLFAVAVHDILDEVVLVDAPVTLFRIGEVQLPPSVIRLSLESAIAVQRNEILANTQQVVIIRAETARLVAEVDAETNQVLQYADNSAGRLVQNSRSYANQVSIRARGLGIASLISTMNFTTSNKTMAIVNRLAQIDNAVNTRYVTASASLLEITV